MEILILLLLTLLVLVYASYRFQKGRKRRLNFHDEGHPDAYNQAYVKAMNETFKRA